MKFLSTKEVGKLLNITSRTVCNLANAKALPGAVRIGDLWRFRKDVLMDWLTKQTEPEASAAGLKPAMPVPKQHPSPAPR